MKELEGLDQRARPDLVYSKVGQLTRKKATNCTSEAIKDKTRKLLTEPEEMGIKLELDVDKDSKGPAIIYIEVTNAVEALKVGKPLGQMVYQLSFGKHWEQKEQMS